MTQEYQISGMTCTSCEAIIKSSLIQVNHVTDVKVSKSENIAQVTMNTDIPIEVLQNSLHSKYEIARFNETVAIPTSTTNSFKWSDISIWKRAGFNTLNCLIEISGWSFSYNISTPRHPWLYKWF